MASLVDTYYEYDFSDRMGPEVFNHDPPISGIGSPTASDNTNSPLFEPSDTHFLYEDNEAVMGLKYPPSCGSLSPSANSYTSDDMPATPLSSVAETAYFQQAETDQTVFINQSYSELLDRFERESGALSGGQTSSGVGHVQPMDYMTSPSTKGVSSTAAAAGREQTHQKMIVNAVGVKSTSQPSSTRPTVIAARGSSNARQDKNNVPVGSVAKSDEVKVGVKRKTDQGKEKARKVMKSCEDSTVGRNEKNAIAARENRLKKKMEFEDLKRNEAMLEEENQCLRKENSDHVKTIRELEQEVGYYKSVLFNQSSLATVLQSLNPKPKLKLSSSVGVSNVDGDQSMSGGVCLHINGTDASLEWCPKCSMKAKASFSS